MASASSGPAAAGFSSLDAGAPAGTAAAASGIKRATVSEGPSASVMPVKKIGHRSVDSSGETTYKKTTSSALKGAIQLGITHTVGSLSTKPERDVLMQDFLQDIPDGLFLDADMYSALCKTLQRDCLVLQSFKIMDYSLLMSIHNMDHAQREPTSNDTQYSADTRRPAPQKALYSTAMESIQGEARRGGTVETEDHMGGIPARNNKGERLLLYIGIIDILQSYRFVKKLEHSWKALVHDGDTVSVHRPGFYAERFQRFMCNTVFKKIPFQPWKSLMLQSQSSPTEQ